MFVRFQGAILIVAVVAIGGSALEGAALDRRRAIGRQHYRLDASRERVARLRLRAEELGAPSRLRQPEETGRLDLNPPAAPRTEATPSTPLLRWRSAAESGR